MSDFKWGIWYPIETQDGRQLFDIWVPARKMSFRVERASRLGYEHLVDPFHFLDERCFEHWTEQICGEPATHWMPLPPGPDDPAYSPRSTP